MKQVKTRQERRTEWKRSWHKNRKGSNRQEQRSNWYDSWKEFVVK